MIFKNKFFLMGVAALALLLGLWFFLRKPADVANLSQEPLHPVLGTIRSVIDTTGVVEPQNRLEIKPPVAGRIDSMLVKEGDYVVKGQKIAMMSSTERAALLDAARADGDATLDYWREVYKSTPVVAPLDGTVIVRAMEPGQTVTGNDAIIVLSDRLIVKAQVDETDIGKLKVGQSATISLDAYPEIEVPATVDHIAYESTVISNVTIYQVDILPRSVPPVFRSGMSANVEIVAEQKENALLVPRAAVTQDGEKTTVLLVRDGQTPERKRVKIGLSDSDRIEIVQGLELRDTVLVTVADDATPTRGKAEPKSNPFMPGRRRGGGRPGGG